MNYFAKLSPLVLLLVLLADDVYASPRTAGGVLDRVSSGLEAGGLSGPANIVGAVGKGKKGKKDKAAKKEEDPAKKEEK